MGEEPFCFGTQVELPTARPLGTRRIGQSLADLSQLCFVRLPSPTPPQGFDGSARAPPLAVPIHLSRWPWLELSGGAGFREARTTVARCGPATNALACSSNTFDPRCPRQAKVRLHGSYLFLNTSSRQLPRPQLAPSPPNSVSTITSRAHAGPQYNPSQAARSRPTRRSNSASPSAPWCGASEQSFGWGSRRQPSVAEPTNIFFKPNWLLYEVPGQRWPSKLLCDHLREVLYFPSRSTATCRFRPTRHHHFTRPSSPCELPDGPMHSLNPSDCLL